MTPEELEEMNEVAQTVYAGYVAELSPTTLLHLLEDYARLRVEVAELRAACTAHVRPNTRT